MNPMKTFPATALFLFVLTISNLHFSGSKPSGFQFKLIPRDSPESPLYPGNLTHTEKLQRLVKFSQGKANILSTSTTQNATLEPDIFVPLSPYDNLYYVGQVGIGNPKSLQWLLIDTGSGLIWTQCEPCETCFGQNGAFYDSTVSTSYEELPCSDPICSGADERFKCVDGKCVYDYSYVSGSVTKGVASRESFMFQDFNAGPDMTISEIIFGCSNNNKGFEIFEERGVISGIMGLDLHPLSLVSQLSTRIQNRFTYCMAPFAEEIQNNLYLRFGEDVPQHSAGVRTTPFAIVPGVDSYMLNLIGISVGSKRVDLPTDAFQRRPGGSEGFFIDSGSPLTVIGKRTNEEDAHEKVMEAFEKHYKSFKLERKLPTSEDGDELCYINEPDFDSHPTMTYHFEGADYVVDSKFVTVNFREQNYFCVTIVKGDTASVLGGHHQQNMRIIYDNNLKALQFYPENCAEGHMPNHITS